MSGVDLRDAAIVGAGGYGIVVRKPADTTAYKLLYDTQTIADLHEESALQTFCHRLFTARPDIGVSVPPVTWSSTTPTTFREKQYLCGIGMTYLPPPLDFTEQVHIVLSETAGDLDVEWGKTIGQPVSDTNPTRGFFASAETMEWIWQQEGSAMTVERMAWTMGAAFRCMIDAGVVPIDLEWVWSGGRPWLIDFGLCRFGRVDPRALLQKGGWGGLATDFYWPHAGERGHDEFLRGYLGEAR